MKAAIVIPVYKEQIDEDEKRSLKQCFKILSAHSVLFVCPVSLSVSNYELLCKEYPSLKYSFERFDGSYFSSISGYNKLLLSAAFYERFTRFDYILIYQPDAYVFSDRLNEWCSKGFSYVGAPWFIGQDTSNANSGLMEFAGNGGFSLRKIDDFLRVLKTWKITKSPADILKEYGHFNWLLWLLRLPVILCRMLGLRNNSAFERSKFVLNEDHYWAYIAPQINPLFKAARAEQAIDFAFECQPARMYELNKRQLPFGCHAWLKYDYNFWKPFIT